MVTKREYPASSYIKKQNTSDANQPNEVRVKVGNKHFSYASYAGKQLLVAKSEFVYLTAAGAAVSNAIRVIEYLKRHVRGLHVQYKILSKKFIDEYLPTIEGLDKVTTERIVSTLECVLTITKGDQIKGTAGYVEPLPDKEVDQEDFEERIKNQTERKEQGPRGDDERDGSRGRRRGGRPRGRGGRGRPRGGRRDDEGRDYDEGSRGRQNYRRDDEGRGRPRRTDDRDDPRPPRRQYDGERPPRRGGNDGDRPPRRGGNDGDRPPRRGGFDGDRPPRRQYDGDRPPRREGEERPRRGTDRGGDRGGDRPRRPRGGEQRED